MSQSSAEFLIETATLYSPKLSQETFSLISAAYPNAEKDRHDFWLKQLLKFSRSWLIVAKEAPEEPIVGLLTMVSYPVLSGRNKTQIEELIVDSSKDPFEVSRQLLRFALDEADKTGIKEVSQDLTTFEDIHVFRLYTDLGFEMKNRNYFRYSKRSTS